MLSTYYYKKNNRNIEIVPNLASINPDTLGQLTNNILCVCTSYYSYFLMILK